MNPMMNVLFIDNVDHSQDDEGGTRDGDHQSVHHALGQVGVVSVPGEVGVEELVPAVPHLGHKSRSNSSKWFQDMLWFMVS